MDGLIPLPRTLILDYYDSYTNNLLTLFTKLYSDAEVLQKVVVVRHDRYSWDEFQSQVLPYIDCVILSPGPGRPDNPSDIGFALNLIRLHPVPILGVCLGHQAIGTAFGAKIINTPKITHGHVVPVRPSKSSRSLFRAQVGIAGEEASFDVVVYNSLIVDPTTLPADLEVTAWSEPKDDQKTIMGLAHTSLPIWGVQYHPESISSTQGANLLRNFLQEVQSHHSSPSSFPVLPPPVLASCSYRINSCVAKPKKPTSQLHSTIYPTPPLTASNSVTSSSDGESSPSFSNHPLPGASHFAYGSRRACSLRLAEKRLSDVGKTLKTSAVFERMIRNKGKGKAVGEVWLDGENPSRPTVSSLSSPSFLITYCLASHTVTLYSPNSPPSRRRLQDKTFWGWFGDAQNELAAEASRHGKGGWQGGWTGWFGYEMKEESLPGYTKPSLSGPSSQQELHETIDACWAWSDWLVERNVPGDGEWTLRGLLRDEAVAQPSEDVAMEEASNPRLSDWLRSAGVEVGLSHRQFDQLHHDILDTLSHSQAESSKTLPPFPSFRPRSNAKEYQSKIQECRESIRQGDSYELTLTTPFTSTLPPSVDPYDLFIRLRTQNPACYSTYLSFPDLNTGNGRGMNILSSSPERFLKIENGDEGRRIEMMPIKGTKARVKRGTCVCTPTTGCRSLSKGSEACKAEAQRVDQEIGRELQEDIKERAENLMIVDLIRSDLLSSCIPSSVTVPKLIALETHGVHHLVTTVQGMLGENIGSVEAVKRCFPPGSMTGAPKLRSVQLLDEYEDHQRRGVYSGALGYISADGATDLSVVIRTIIVEGSHMYLGAGGAITWMSDAGNEWEEVRTKVKSVIGSLDE